VITVLPSLLETVAPPIAVFAPDGSSITFDVTVFSTGLGCSETILLNNTFN